MKILFPHREVNLDIDSRTVPPIEERKKIVNSILIEKIEFHNQVMTVEEYLTHTWEKQSTKAILDMLGYYLTKESFTEDQKNDTNYFGEDIKEDRFILSNRSIEEMEKGSKRHTTISSMGQENNFKLGFEDYRK